MRTLDGNGNTSSDSVSIHVSVIGANTVTGSGFANFVYQAFYNGDHQQDAIADALHGGQWWSTKSLVGGIATQGSTATFQALMANSPGAQIIAISVDNGDTSGSGTTPAANYQAGADALVVGFGSSFTRYDFGG